MESWFRPNVGVSSGEKTVKIKRGVTVSNGITVKSAAFVARIEKAASMNFTRHRGTRCKLANEMTHPGLCER